MTIPIDSYTSLNGIKRYICTLGKKVLFSMDIPPPHNNTHCSPFFKTQCCSAILQAIIHQHTTSPSPSYPGHSASLIQVSICHLLHHHSIKTLGVLSYFLPSFEMLLSLSLHVSLLQNYICYSCSLYINKSLLFSLYQQILLL